MKSYGLKTVGGHTEVALRDSPVPLVTDEQVLVRVRAAGMNRGEFIAGHGIHAESEALVDVGNEAAGEITTVGSQVTGLAVGDRVMGRCSGAYSEYAVMDFRDAMLIPDGMSWVQAAAVPIGYMVAYDVLIAQGNVSPGNWVLIVGASSGVGVATALTAKALGARVIGTSSSAKKLARLKALGLDATVDTSKSDLYQEVMAVTQGEGVHLVADIVGGSVFGDCIRCLKLEGRLAVVGYVDGVVESRLDLGALHAKRLTVFGVSNKLHGPVQRRRFVDGFLTNILPLIASGGIRPLVDKVFSFDEFPQAKDYMEANRQLGKIVVRGPKS